MNQQLDNRSEGGFSGSDSQSSQNSNLVLDIETLKLGTDNVKKLILLSTLYSTYPAVFMTLAHTLEFTQMFEYCGEQLIFIFAITQPLIRLFTIKIPVALAAASNEYVQKNIAKQQLVAAEVYLAHYFILAFVTCLLTIILYFIAFQNLIKDSIKGDYLLLRMVPGSILCMLAFSIDSFFGAENRDFILISKDTFFACIFCIVLIVCYVNTDKLGVSMTNAAIAYVVSAGVTTLHLFIAIMRIPIMDIQYRGILKFSLKKLSPIRWKILIQMLVHGLVCLMVNNNDEILFLEIALLNKYLIKQRDVLYLQNMKLITYFFFLEYSSFFNRIFTKVFTNLVVYNIGIKRISRIWEIMKWTLIFMCCISIPFIVIIGFAGRYVYKYIFPVIDGSLVYKYSISETINIPVFAAVSQLLKLPHYIATVIVQVEGKEWLTLLIQLPAFLYVASYSVVSFIQVKDNAPTTTLLWLSEINNFFIGWIIMVYYIIKYRKLYYINKKNADMEKNNDQDSQEALRKVVIEQLAVGVELKKDNFALRGMFDKKQQLIGNDNFFSLRDAIIGQSRPETATDMNTPRTDEMLIADNKVTSRMSEDTKTKDEILLKNSRSNTSKNSSGE